MADCNQSNQLFHFHENAFVILQEKPAPSSDSSSSSNSSSSSESSSSSSEEEDDHPLMEQASILHFAIWKILTWCLFISGTLWIDLVTGSLCCANANHDIDAFKGSRFHRVVQKLVSILQKHGVCLFWEPNRLCDRFPLLRQCQPRHRCLCKFSSVETEC